MSNKYLEMKVRFNKIFDKNAKMPSTEKECWEMLGQLACELSPENLCCDGELSGAAVAKKRKDILGAWKYLEGILGRKVDEDQVDAYLMKSRS